MTQVQTQVAAMACNLLSNHYQPLRQALFEPIISCAQTIEEEMLQNLIRISSH